MLYSRGKKRGGQVIIQHGFFSCSENTQNRLLILSRFNCTWPWTRGRNYKKG